MLKHKVYLKMCFELSTMSKCVKHKVGAMIVRESRIISTGVNGTPSGFVNCCDHFSSHDMGNREHSAAHRVWSKIYEIHAEMNAILHAARKGLSVEDAVIYCTLEPCFNCLKHIIAAGISEVYYANKHCGNLDSAEAREMIEQLGIKIEHIQL
jgi:dCMP deaminase